MKKTISLSFSLSLFAFVFSTQALAINIGDSIPQIIGRTTTGGMYALSQHKTKPKVLNFFWVQCVPCRKEIPLLAEKALANPNVEFVVVHAENDPKTDNNYDISEITTFINGLDAAPEVVVLGSAKLKEDLSIKAFPMSILVSSENKIEKILSGFNEEAFNTELDKWLEIQN